VFLAEVDAAGELAHEHQVDAGDDLGFQRRGVGERWMHAHRAQVGEGAELAAQAQEPRLGPQLRIGRRPAGSADRPE